MKKEFEKSRIGMKELRKKELEKLIKKGENDKVELKHSLSQLKEIVQTVSSFANSKGGLILVGVSDSKKINGVDIGKQTIEQLTNKIVDNTDYHIYPEIFVEKINNKNVILIKVEEGKQKPYTAFGRVYIRIGKNNKLMSKAEYDKIVLEHKEYLFDSEICVDASLEDIDEEAVKWYLDKKEEARNVKKPEISYNQLLINVGAAKKVNGEIKPTNAGILFFGKNPQRFFVQSKLRLVKFKGKDVTCPALDKLDCSGCIWEMIKDAEEFIRKNIRLLSYRTEASFQREGRFEYPIKALREAIINALIHRDYNELADTRVFIFDDRFEVISPGKFPDGVTPEKPEHKPVNPILCSLIYDVGWIEKYGSGIQMMKKLSRQFGNKEPYYEFSKIQTKIIFESPIKETTMIEIKDVSKELNERQKTALWYLTEHKKIKREEYMKLCKCSEATAKRDIEKLVSKGIIKRVLAGKYTYYILSKYKPYGSSYGSSYGSQSNENTKSKNKEELTKVDASWHKQDKKKAQNEAQNSEKGKENGR